MPIQLYIWMGKRYPLGNLSLFAANFSDKLWDIKDIQLHQNQWPSELGENGDEECMWMELWLVVT